MRLCLKFNTFCSLNDHPRWWDLPTRGDGIGGASITKTTVMIPTVVMHWRTTLRSWYKTFGLCNTVVRAIQQKHSYMARFTSTRCISYDIQLADGIRGTYNSVASWSLKENHTSKVVLWSCEYYFRRFWFGRHNGPPNWSLSRLITRKLIHHWTCSHWPGKYFESNVL